MATNTLSDSSGIDDLTLIWADGDVNRNEENLNAQKDLHNIFNNVQTFEDIDQCQTYIETQLEKYRFVLIVSEQFGQELVPRIHQLSQILAIYVVCFDQAKHSEWSQKFTKIKAVVVDVNKLTSLIREGHRNRTAIKKAQLAVTLLASSTSGAIPSNQTNESNDCDSNIAVFQFSLKDLVNAGELEYTDKKMNDIAEDLVKKFNDEYDRNLTFLILDALCPMMYLLKREQNLSDFVEPLKKLLLKEKAFPRLSQRWLVDALMINSNRFLCRRLTILLSKRNPVPMIQPSIGTINNEYRFVSSIVHVWDTSRPILFSFGIGECKGKTLLVNSLFETNFEQSLHNNYFCGTIDLDFGYHFVRRRCINVADAHGSISIDTLKRIYQLFNAFIIHIESDYFTSNTSELISFLQILSHSSYILLLIRDLDDDDDEDVRTAVTTVNSVIPNCGVFLLPNIVDKSDYMNKSKIDKLREQIFSSVATFSHPNEQNIQEHLKQLMDPAQRGNAEQDKGLIDHIRPILIDGKEDDYPLYSLFTRMCDTRHKIGRIDPYSPDFEDKGLHDLQSQLFTTSEELKKQQLAGLRATGQGFQLFFQLLRNNDDLLNNLNLLSIELKREQEKKTSVDLMSSFCERLSLDIHWRNAIICWKNVSNSDQQLLVNAYYNYIAEGNPFEIIDGDNFEMQSEFLTEVLSLFQNKKIFVMSIIGPQNSGKSTLFNFLFGTLFEVRDDRCTRGLYGILVNIESKVIKNKLLLSKYDYILLIDTEGLSSIQQGDEQYDKRLILFCLAISHLVIVNISGEIYKALTQTFILCTESLNYLEATRVNQPTVHFVLNQRTDLNKANYEEHVRITRNDLIAHGPNNVINLGPNNFHILPCAFNSTSFSAANYKCDILSTNIQFVTDVQKLCKIFVDSSFEIIGKTGDDFSKPAKWIQIANSILQIIKQYPNLTYFKDIFEREQNNSIREDIGKDLQDYLSPAKGQQMIDKEKENSADHIQVSFKLEQERILEILTSKLEANLEKCRANKSIRYRSLRFLDIQVTSRFRSWEVSAIMASQRFKLDQIVNDAENEVRRLALNTVRENQLMDKDFATVKFEKMWTDRFAGIVTEFNSQTQWKQSIDLACRLYDVFGQDALPSYDNVLTYLPFLMSLDTTDQPIVFNQSLLKICAKCQSQASINNPLGSNSTNKTYTPCATDLLKPHKFLKNEELASILHKADGKSARTRRAIAQGVHQDLSQQISDKWQTVVRVSYCFELLTERMKIIFKCKIEDERSIEFTLVQEILEAVNALIQDMNQELNIFNFSMSRSLQSILHICAALSIAFFYYHRHKTHFNDLAISIDQNKRKWHDQFLRMVVVQENNDENIAADLVNQLSDVLHKSFGREVEDINRKKIENELLTLDRYSIMQELDNEVHGAPNDCHMRHVLSPTEISIEKFDQRWKQIERALRQEVNITINSHLELLAEFFHRIIFIQCALVLNARYSLTFTDDLFQPSNSKSEPNQDDKKLCMTTLIYQYLSEESISSEISTKNGSNYIMETEWRETINNITKQTEQLKNIFRSMKDTFEAYSITYIHIFLEKILSNRTEIEETYKSYMNTLAENSCRSTRTQLFDRIRNCQVQWPCCKRLCDVDHRLDTDTPVGQGENNHQYLCGHQIREEQISKEKEYYEGCKKYYQITGKPIISKSDNINTESESSRRIKIGFDQDYDEVDLNALIDKFCTVLKISSDDVEILKVQTGSVLLEMKIKNNITLRAISDTMLEAEVQKELGKISVFFLFLGDIEECDNKIKLRNEVKLNDTWNRIYYTNHTYWSGVLNDGKDRGGQPYYCPVGWKRYSFFITETAEQFYEKFKGWCIGYHGTKFQHGLSILLSGLKPASAADHGQGVYLSPSIIYACHPRYSEIKPIPLEHQSVFGKSAKYIQFVLECRVRPQDIERKWQTFHTVKTRIDPNIPNNVIEWIVNTNGKSILDFEDPNATLICTGLMIRITNNHPYLLSESQWWEKTCPCNNNSHCAWNADRGDLRKQKAKGVTCSFVFDQKEAAEISAEASCNVM